MIRNFDHQESYFNRVLAISNRDFSSFRVGRKFTEPGPMASARWDGYTKPSLTL
jgi:hypothetical protein